MNKIDYPVGYWLKASCSSFRMASNFDALSLAAYCLIASCFTVSGTTMIGYETPSNRCPASVSTLSCFSSSAHSSGYFSFPHFSVCSCDHWSGIELKNVPILIVLVGL